MRTKVSTLSYPYPYSYMSQLVLSRGVNVRRNFLRKFLSDLHFGPYFLIGSLVLFVALVTVITLMFSTRQVTKGYVLNKLDMLHQDLVKQSEMQEMKISQVRALKYIEESPKVQFMRRPAEVVFVSGQGNLASR